MVDDPHVDHPGLARTRAFWAPSSAVRGTIYLRRLLGLLPGPRFERPGVVPSSVRFVCRGKVGRDG